MPLAPPEPLSDAHELNDFFCRAASLDDWLKRRARANQVSGASRTFVVAENRQVVGYYAIAAGAITVDTSVGLSSHHAGPDTGRGARSPCD